MDIALVTGEFPPKWGGIGSHCFNLTKKLAKKHTIHIITRKLRGGSIQVDSNIYLHNVRYLPLPVAFTKSVGKNCINYLLKNLSVDLIHLQYQMISVPTKYFKRIETPIVSTFHGSWKGEQESLKNASIRNLNVNDIAVKYISHFYRKYETIGFDNSMERITVSNHSAEELSSYRDDISTKDFNIIPNGVDTKTFSPDNRDIDNKKIRLLFVGRFAARKGIFDLLDVFKKISKKRDDVELYLIGRGKLNVKIKNVTILSGLPFDRLVQEYANADIFVLPSYYEGQGIVLLEAMASGLPCISTEVGGVPETVINKKNGILLKPGDKATLEKTLLDLVEDEQLRKKYGNNGRKRMIKHYDWDIIAKKTERVYGKVI